MLLNAEGVTLTMKEMMDDSKEDEYLVPQTVLINPEFIQSVTPAAKYPGFILVLVGDEQFRVKESMDNFRNRIKALNLLFPLN